MIHIVLGIFDFIIVHLFDMVSLKRIPSGAKPCVWAAGSGLLVYPVIMLCLQSNTLSLPIWSMWLGWGLSLFLLIYSLFVNLPFRKTYVATGVGDKLITTGLYVLVRHPWIHCFTLTLLSLVLVSRSNLLLIAVTIWILLNIPLVIIQDKFFFGKVFQRYDSYRQEAPMLVPNRWSINAFMNSLEQSRT